MRLSSPFMSAGMLRRGGESEVAAFTSRQFAANRAGFLLREYAKQQEEISLEGFSMGGDEVPAELTAVEAAVPVVFDAPPAPGPVSGISVDNSERLVREAEQRGRELAMAEMSAPAAKAFSLPVTMMQPMVSSASKAFNAVPSSSIKGPFKAFRALGRFSVMMPTLPPSMRTSMFS
jgi:hypothetical protein